MDLNTLAFAGVSFCTGGNQLALTRMHAYANAAIGAPREADGDESANVGRVQVPPGPGTATRSRSASVASTSSSRNSWSMKTMPILARLGNSKITKIVPITVTLKISLATYGCISPRSKKAMSHTTDHLVVRVEESTTC